MRVSYDKETRALAKKRGQGLITIAWENPAENGRGASIKMQGPAGPKTLAYIKRVLTRTWEKEGEK